MKYGIGKCEYANKEADKFETFATTEPIVFQSKTQITKEGEELFKFIKMQRFKHQYAKHLEEKWGEPMIIIKRGKDVKN